MSDVNANIGVHIDTSLALAELKNLQRQLANFHSAVSKSSIAAAVAQKNLQTNLINSINETGKFRAQMGVIKTSTESFTSALEKNKLSMREYFRYAGGASRTFGKLFRSEFDTINRVATERVKDLQTQYIKMGRDANGAMRAISVRPLALDMENLATKTQIAAQKQALFNQLVKQGSTSLLNFGKNTQWAGRQLMVGFSIPLAYFGTAASKVFMDLEAQAVKFKRVYGDAFTTSAETNKALEDLEALAKNFTKYGVSVTSTLEMAGKAAAMGKMGADLTAQVAEATRLAILGNVEQEQSLETTISLTNAFGLAAEDLAGKINFLNAVENQTVTAIEDLTIAIPKAGPVIQGLGGSVEDLAFFLTAMREGGINASEGANALKSGLASLINPTAKASAMLADMGINIKGIVEGNVGNVRQTVIDFAEALDTLAPLERSRAIEQLFGKFQFARLDALFTNVIKDGGQAAKVLDLAGKSVEELAILAEREMKNVEDAVGTNFKEAVEDLKIAIAPIGKTFLETITPILKIIGEWLEKFNGLSDGTKKFIVVAGTLLGIIGPTFLMAFGLVANGVANLIKLFAALRGGLLKLTGNSTNLGLQTQYMTTEQAEAATVAAALNQSHNKLIQTFTVEAGAVAALRNAYVSATSAATAFAMANPGMMAPIKGVKGAKFASGTAEVVGGQAGKDSVPALLMPGEAVIPTAIAQDDRFKPLIQALVSGDIQGFSKGTDEVTNRKRRKLKSRLYKKFAYNTNAYGDKVVSQQYLKNIESFNKVIDGLEYDSKTKTYTFTNNKGEKFTNIPERRLLEKADYTFGQVPSQQGELVNPKTKFGKASSFARQIERLSKDAPRTSAPKDVLDLKKKNIELAGAGVDRENVKLVEALKKVGYTKRQITDFTQSHLSHILDPKNPAIKWTEGQVFLDNQGLNQYIKGAGGPAVEKLLKDPRLMLPPPQGLGMNQRDLRVLTQDWAWASNKKHPTNMGEFRRYARLAAFQEAMHNAQLAKLPETNLRLVKGINALSSVRDVKGSPFYKDLHERIIQLGKKPKFGVSRAEVDRLTKEIKLGAVVKGREAFTVLANRTKEYIENVKTGKQRPITGPKVDTSIMGPSKIAPNDDTLTTLYRNEGIRQKPKTGNKPSFKRVGRVLVPNAKEAPFSIPFSDAPAVPNSINKDMDDLSKETKATTGKMSVLGGKFATGAHVFSGLTMMGSFMEGKIGEVSQKLMPFAMGLSTIVMIFPMLKAALLRLVAFLALHPLVAAVAAIVATVLVFKKIDSNAKKLAASTVELTKQQIATADRMKQVGLITGKVGATELQAKRDELGTSNKFTTGFERGKSQFGTTFLDSEFGKKMYENFKNSLTKGGTEAARTIALELGAYISDGVMSAEQAFSVARSIGINLQDMTIATQIKGQLIALVGPDGKDAFKDGITLRTKLIQGSKESVESALANVKAGQGGLDLGGLTYDDEDIKNASILATTSAQYLGTIKSQIAASRKVAEEKIKDLEAEKAKTKNAKEIAKINKQINTIKKEQSTEEDKLQRKYKKGLDMQVQAFEQTRKGLRRFGAAGQAFISAQDKGIRDRYKGTGKEADAEEFLRKAKGTKSEEFEVKLKALVEGGVFEAKTLTNLLNIYGKDGEGKAEAMLTLALTKKDPGKIAEFISTVNGFKDKTLSQKILIDAMSEDGLKGKKLENRLEVINKMQDLDNKEVSVELFIKTNGLAALDELYNQLDYVEGIKGPIDATVIANIKAESNDPTMPNFDALLAVWHKYDGLADETKKTVIQEFITLERTITDNEAAASLTKKGIPGKLQTREALDKEKGIIATELMPSAEKYKEDEKKKTGGNTGDPKDRDKTYDDLLKRLRATRQATINVEGGLGVLLEKFKKTGGEGWKAFKGIENAMLDVNSVGKNRELMDYLGGLDKKTFASFVNMDKLKKGVFQLLPAGKALEMVFNDLKISEYVTAQQDAAKSSNAQKIAFEKLIRAGMDASLAMEVVADSEMAVAINSKAASGELKKTVDELVRADAVVKRNAFVQFLRNQEIDIAKKLNLAGIIPQLKEMGMTAQQVQQVLDNPTIADGLIAGMQKGKVQAQDVLNLLNAMERTRVATVIIDVQQKGSATVGSDAFSEFQSKFNEYYDATERFLDLKYAPQIQEANDAYDTAIKNADDLFKKQSGDAQDLIDKAEQEIAAEEGKLTEIQNQIKAKQTLIDQAQKEIDAIDEVIDGYQKQIDILQRKIELDFDRPIEALQDSVDAINREIELDFDRPIEALQEESSDLSNDLALIDQAAEQINKKYDAQVKALEQVKKVNEQIINQQKSQIGLADALSQGDISAAAKIMQDMRAANAQSASGSVMDALQASREAEIAGLRSASGMTREQIEKRQFEISQQIYALEEKREAKQLQIRTIQDQIYKLEQGREVILRQIRDYEDKIYQQNLLKEPIIAKIKGYEKEMEVLRENERLQEEAIAKIRETKLKDAEKAMKAAEDAHKQALKNAEEEKEKALKIIEDKKKAEMKALDDLKAKIDLKAAALKLAAFEADKLPELMKDAAKWGYTLAKNLQAIWSGVDLSIPEEFTNPGDPGDGTGGGGGGGGGGNLPLSEDEEEKLRIRNKIGLGGSSTDSAYAAATGATGATTTPGSKMGLAQGMLELAKQQKALLGFIRDIDIEITKQKVKQFENTEKTYKLLELIEENEKDLLELYMLQEEPLFKLSELQKLITEEIKTQRKYIGEMLDPKNKDYGLFWIYNWWEQIFDLLVKIVTEPLKEFKKLMTEIFDLIKEVHKELVAASKIIVDMAANMEKVAAAAEAARTSIANIERYVLTIHEIRTVYTTQGSPPATPAPGTPAPGTPAPGTPAPGTPAPGTPTPPSDPFAGILVNKGGYIKMAGGGTVPGPSVNRDVIPAMLTPGEYVINRNATSKFLPLLQAINGGSYPSLNMGGRVKGMLGFNQGGLVPQKLMSRPSARNMVTPSFNHAMSVLRSAKTPTFSNRGISGGMSNIGIPAEAGRSQVNNQTSAPVYNYSVNVSVGGTNADANTIANVVLSKIQGIEAQKIRTQAVYV